MNASVVFIFYAMCRALIFISQVNVIHKAYSMLLFLYIRVFISVFVYLCYKTAFDLSDVTDNRTDTFSVEFKEH